MPRWDPSIRRTLVVCAAIAFATVCAMYFVLLPLDTEQYFGPDPAAIQPPYRVSEQARALHERILVADLHADTMLWTRDIVPRAEYGHVDVPRMIEGNVALQAFLSVPDGVFNTRDPSIERGVIDPITLIALLDRWPLRALRSHKARAVFMAERLWDAAERSGGRLTVIESREDLEAYLERRRSEPAITAGILGIEGGRATQWDTANLRVLFDAGYRMMELAHYADTPVAGSSSGKKKGGLTELGRSVVQEMEAMGMIVDLAHASPQAIDDVLDMATRPVIATHVGVRGTCDNVRNLSDEHIDRIAANGGVIGIGFFPEVTCSEDLGGIVRALRHIRDRVGAEHAALGSAFDSPVKVQLDATGLVVLTDALLADGFTESEVAAIMGGSVIDFFLEALPNEKQVVPG